MIPENFIENWRKNVSWQTLAMIEQDKDLFHRNIELKRLNKDFQIDMSVLLPHTIQWNFDQAFEFMQNSIISKL